MKTLLLLLLTALGSLIELPITGGEFRASAGIIILMAYISYKKPEKILLLGPAAGMMVCLTRVAMASLSGVDVSSLVGSYMLEVFFYIGYVGVYCLMTGQADPIYPMPQIMTLAVADFGGNFLEYVVRYLAGNESWSGVPLKNLLIAAFVRAMIIMIVVRLWQVWEQSRKGGNQHA